MSFYGINPITKWPPGVYVLTNQITGQPVGGVIQIDPAELTELRAERWCSLPKVRPLPIQPAPYRRPPGQSYVCRGRPWSLPATWVSRHYGPPNPYVIENGYHWTLYGFRRYELHELIYHALRRLWRRAFPPPPRGTRRNAW